MMCKLLKVKRLTPTAKLPTQAYDSEDALDIYSDANVNLYPGCLFTVSTGLAVEIPKGYRMVFWDKSGLALRGITVLGGLIDSSYRGELKVILKDVGFDVESSFMYTINKGDKITQAFLVPVVYTEVIEVDELSETVRQDKGFGSSGK